MLDYIVRQHVFSREGSATFSYHTEVIWISLEWMLNTETGVQICRVLWLKQQKRVF